MKNDQLRYSVLWAFIGALFFIPFLGGVHLFDWDEINFAEISREMIRLEDYLRVFIDYEAFYQKPPLFFWLQVLAMQAFGVGEFAARFPNAICGIITLVVLFRLGSHLYGTRFGNLWALCYLGSILPFLYFKSGIIDPYFNLFIFLGLYHIILYYWKKEGFNIALKRSQWFYLSLGGIFLGLGILTKGPVAFLIACLTMGVYWIYQRLRFYITIPAFLLLTLVSILVTMTWLGTETLINGPGFLQSFLAYNVELATTESAGHGGFPGYHFVVLLLGCFPASVFALRAFRKLPAEEKDYQNDFRIWMKYLFWVVLILFTIVESKIVHYSSMCYFPLTYLSALVLIKIDKAEIPYKKWMSGLLIGISSLYCLVILAFPIIGKRATKIQDMINDPFAKANLAAEVNWNGTEIIAGIWLLAVVILSVWYRKLSQNEKAIKTLFGGTAIFVMLTLVFFIKRIEGYSQRANLEFFKSLQGEDAYVYTYGYKSYAHLFYSDKAPNVNATIRAWDPEKRQDWLLKGDIDKPVYLSVRIHKADQIRALEDWQEIGEKNGFVFFRRSP